MNEEALTTYNDSLYINQLRNAVRSSGKMSEQRVPFSVREESRQGLEDWWSDRFDAAFMNQITGYAGQADTRYTGHNATVAPNAENITYVTGTDVSGTAILAASSNAVFTLQLLDYAKEKAKMNTAPIRPIKVNGESKYVSFLSPVQVTSLRTNTNSGQWLDIQKAALAGGNGKQNPIYTGALGEYNGIIIHESTRIPRVFNAADATASDEAGVYRAVLCGAQACALAFGRDNSKDRATWHEELFDYGNQLGVSSGFIWGMKKLRFNNKDFGTIAIETFGRRR